MPNYCSNCGKLLTTFNPEFKCRGCGNIFCKSCISKINIVYDSNEYKYVNYYLPNFEFSFLLFSYVACSNCKNILNKYTTLFKEKEHEYAEMLSKQLIEYERKNTKKENMYKNIKIYSINYKGKIRHSSYTCEISSNYYRNRKDAEIELRKIAVELECDIIYNFEYTVGTGCEYTNLFTNKHCGEHYYSIFKASGIASKSI